MKIGVALALLYGLSAAASPASAQDTAPTVAFIAGVGITPRDPFNSRGTALATVELTRPISKDWSAGVQLWASSDGLIGDCVVDCDRTFPTMVAAFATAQVRARRITMGGGFGYVRAHSPAFSPQNTLGVIGLVSYEAYARQPLAVDVLVQPLLLPNAFGGPIWILPIGVGARFTL